MICTSIFINVLIPHLKSFSIVEKDFFKSFISLVRQTTEFMNDSDS